MEPQCRPLRDTLHDIPDPRHARGRRHPLAAILALRCVAMVYGSRSDSAIADWGRCDGQKLARALGFTHDQTPCAATLHHVLRQLDGSLGEAALGAWADSILTALPRPPAHRRPEPSTAPPYAAVANTGRQPFTSGRYAVTAWGEPCGSRPSRTRPRRSPSWKTACAVFSWRDGCSPWRPGSRNAPSPHDWWKAAGMMG